MPLLKESNPSSLPPQNERVEMTNLALQERLQELEVRNYHLQGLVVELLNKNEQLRRTLEQLEKGKNA